MPSDFNEDGSFIYKREEAAQGATLFLYIVNVDLIKQEKQFSYSVTLARNPLLVQSYLKEMPNAAIQSNCICAKTLLTSF